MTDSARDPNLVVRGTLSPSTISLSSPDVTSIEIVLTLDLSLRDTSDYITLYTRDCFLHPGHESSYSSNYVLYNVETLTEVDHGIMQKFRSNRIIVKDPENVLLELEPPGEIDRGASEESDHTLCQQLNGQKPVQIKIKLGMHFERPAEKPAPAKLVSSTDLQGSSNDPKIELRPDTQDRQQVPRSSAVICASPLSLLEPGAHYQIKTGNYPARHIWWWKRGKKAEIIANAGLKDRTGLLGPVTVPQTGETVYGLERLGVGAPIMRVDYIDPPILKVVL